MYISIISTITDESFLLMNLMGLSKLVLLKENPVHKLRNQPNITNSANVAKKLRKSLNDLDCFQSERKARSQGKIILPCR